MSEFKEFEPKFDDWWEENYINVSADKTEAFDIYSLGLKHQQAKVEELQKRVDQQGLIIAKAMSIASDLQKSWSMFKIGKKLEQAFKGGG